MAGAGGVVLLLLLWKWLCGPGLPALHRGGGWHGGPGVPSAGAQAAQGCLHPTEREQQ